MKNLRILKILAVLSSIIEKIQPILIFCDDFLIKGYLILWLHLNNNYFDTLEN